MKRREFIALAGGGGLLLAAKVRRARAATPPNHPMRDPYHHNGGQLQRNGVAWCRRARRAVWAPWFGVSVYVP
jgi:hypothetical protein